MLSVKKLLPTLLLPVLLVGCTSITNLTPTQQTRNAAGLYPVEIAWESKRATIVKDTIAPVVQIGFESYPMRQTPLLKNRWETLIPVPVGTNYVNYRVRVDFEYNDFPARRVDSKLSQGYQLRIKD